VASIAILSPSDPIPSGSAVYVAGADVAVFLEVKGRIDLDDEIGKAQTKLKKASEGAAKQSKLLGDETFKAKSSKAVVEGEERKLEEFKAQEKNYEKSLEQFERLKLGS
jgi:valyl-tRNA synthetase